ncbi:carboxylesterase 1-like [Amaranthus tricolor]|uniref:carboxylesterase 1-like n=1 Tax=Amaranthus tricolor TaxID=29722 RepID=UPI00258C1BA6|nr:carboxylesterase 1-like [Amaranthus tricolor]
MDEYPTKLLMFTLLTTYFFHIQANLDQTKSLNPQNFTIIDPYLALHLIQNPDGSITRIKDFYPTVPPNTSRSLAFSKDVSLNPDKKTWIRVYLPNKPEPIKNLPIIVYSHGGGFVILSTTTPNFDSFLSNMASQLSVLVVSVEYRLAPEHRLPSAYDDVLEALFWIKDKKDEWVIKYGDVSKCILMGESVGGNIAYTVGLKASHLINNLQPLIIRGLVLIQPVFGGVYRTRSELRLGGNTGDLPLVIPDFLWNLSLPIGANRNHPYCNPIIHGGSGSELRKIRELGWPVLIAGCDGDLFIDKQVEVYKFLKKNGVNVASYFSEGDYHGVFVTKPSKARKLFNFVRVNFIKILYHTILSYSVNSVK